MHLSCGPSFLDAFPRGVVYTVEFEDGSPAELQEDNLAPLASNESSRQFLATAFFVRDADPPQVADRVRTYCFL
jgi:hypothetical protein